MCCFASIPRKTHAKLSTGNSAQNIKVNSAKEENENEIQEFYSRISNPMLFYSTRNKYRQLRAALSTKPVLQLDRNRRSLCEKNKSQRQSKTKFDSQTINTKRNYLQIILTLY